MDLQQLRAKYGQNMTEQQCLHIEGIIERFGDRVYAKYAKGQQEHQGDLWAKAVVLDEAINETLDLVVYLDTVQMQVEAAGVPLGVHVVDEPVTP